VQVRTARLLVILGADERTLFPANSFLNGEYNR
jgi:hypothetical protein